MDAPIMGQIPYCSSAGCIANFDVKANTIKKPIKTNTGAKLNVLFTV
jgi:invasion protein IalB